MRRAADGAIRLTPELILAAYAQGIFPMAESADASDVFWLEPRRRGVLPLRAAPLVPGGGLHVGRTLRRSLRRKLCGGKWRASCDQAFEEVIEACAARPETWINRPIRQVFCALHRLGHAHSIEVWDETGNLAGGIYGLAQGGAFFAESMFSRRTDGSKIALVELVARLERGGFMLLDTQYLTDHLARLGGIEIGRTDYRQLLAAALHRPARHDPAFVPAPADGRSSVFCFPSS